ncbi:MAG: DUF2281 domain-containing protein [Elainellaceae cyanobacterium]
MIEKLRRLPPEQQRQLLDFAEFLLQKVEQKELSSRVDWRSPCVGMWRDRDDLEDSTAWVRQLRQQEWNR